MEVTVPEDPPPANRAVSTAFGCRSPCSEGPGHWDGACVLVCSQDDTWVGAVFSEGKDFVTHPKDLAEAVSLYRLLTSKGWTPMSVDDIRTTAGVAIDERTRTYRDPWWWRWKRLFSCLSVTQSPPEYS